MDLPLVGFLVSKLFRVIAILLGVTLITFLLMHLIPGSPWSNYGTQVRMQIGVGVDSSIQRVISHYFGLDLPPWRQYTRYILGDIDEDGKLYCGAVCGNLGPSIRQHGRSVQDILFAPPENRSPWDSRFGYSLRMVLFASLAAAGMGIPLGMLCAMNPRSPASRLISLGLASLVSVPNFVLGLLAIVVLASWLKIIRVLPNWNEPSQWVVPVLVLAAMPMANLARVTQATLMNVLHEDYVRTARAKGLAQRRVLLVHVMRNAVVPILTFLGPTVMEMLTGLLVVENLFSFPGFGREYWEAVLNLDYPMIMGLTLIYAVGVLVIITLIEVLCLLLDPRIRSAKQQEASI